MLAHVPAMLAWHLWMSGVSDGSLKKMGNAGGHWDAGGVLWEQPIKVKPSGVKMGNLL
jgi:hypothetical protein